MKDLRQHLLEAAGAVRVGDQAGAERALGEALAIVEAAPGGKQVPAGLDLEAVLAKAAAHDAIESKLHRALDRIRGHHLDRNANAKRMRRSILDVVLRHRNDAVTANRGRQSADGDARAVALGKLHRELQAVKLPDGEELVPDTDEGLLGGP